jgi:hypothetical protein
MLLSLAASESRKARSKERAFFMHKLVIAGLVPAIHVFAA